MELEVEEQQAQLEQEKAKMYIQYLSNIFSQPQFDKPNPEYLQAKREFEALLMPKVQKKAEQPKKYEWDFDVEEVMQKRLEGR